MAKKSADEVLSPEDSRYWFRWLSSCKEASKQHFNSAKLAYREYLNVQPEVEGATQQLKRIAPKRYPIWWSAIKTIQPAYYSKTPIPVAHRRFDADDPTGRTACILGERASQYFMDCSPYDQVMGAARDDFILADKATVRVFFEASIGEEPKKEYIEPTVLDDGSQAFIDDQGQVIMNVKRDEDGLYFTEEKSEYLEDKKVYLLPVAFDEVYHTPYARHWDEVQDVAFKSILTREEFSERFGSEKAALVSFKKREQGDKNKTDNTSTNITSPELFIEVWEIWRKKTKDVIWVTESYKEDFLDQKDDPYELEGFFPCPPFIIGTKPDKSLYPTPNYIQLRPVLDQMNSLYNKLFELITAVRRRGIADASIDEVIQAINGAWDNEIIAVQNFAQIVEKGGLESLIQYIPVGELSQAITELQGLKQAFKNDFDELYGAADILRGVAEKGVGVETQQLKADYASLRSTVPMKQMQKLARDAIELLLDLGLKKFEDSELQEIMGYEYLDEADQQNFFPALALLRDDKARHVRIDIETDSTSYIRDQELKEQRNEVIQTIIQGFGQITSLQGEDPTYLDIGFKLLLSSLRGQTLGKQWEADIEAIESQLQDKMNQPPPPPPPDYEQMKIDLAKTQQQLDQMKMQQDGQLALEGLKLELQKHSDSIAMEQQKAQIDLQQFQAKNAMEAQIANLEIQIQQTKAQIDSAKVQLDSQIAANDMLIKTRDLDIKAKEADTQTALDAFNMQAQDRIAQVDNVFRSHEILVKAQELGLEKSRLAMEAYEKSLEARRIAVDEASLHTSHLSDKLAHAATMVGHAIEHHKNQTQAQAAATPESAKPKKKTAKIVRDAMGNATVEINEG